MSKVLPTQQECLAIPEFVEVDGKRKVNPEYEEMFAAWALVGVPGPGLGQAVMNMVGLLGRAWSKHLYRCGFRFHPELQQTKRLRPYRGQQHALNGMHQWVGMDVEEPEPIRIQDPAEMTAHEREAQVERLRYLGYRVNEPEPPRPTAQVTDTLDEPPRFDPTTHSVTQVNAYLRDLDDDIERARVLHTERNNRARNGILRRWSE